MTYLENEIKVLDVPVADLVEKIKALGAQEVFNDKRIITHFDYSDGRLLKEKKTVKLTEEGKLKLSYGAYLDTGREAIKLTVSRKKEIVDFLGRLGLFPIAESTSHRISFEWGSVDFDIDEFPNVAPFLEVDLADSGHSVQDVLSKLSLEKKEFGDMTTPDVYKKAGLDYFELFKIKS